MSYASVPDFTGGTELTAAELNVLVDAFNALFPVGFYGYLCRAATTSETLVNGVWLECNGLSVLRATYPDLNTLLGSLSYPFGSADGTHMTLPDGQGRALVSMASGGNTNVDSLADSDGITKASRNPKATISVSGTTGSGGSSPTISGAPGSATGNARVDSGGGNTFSAFVNSVTAGTLAVSGGGAHTHSFSGSGAQTVPYLVGGTLFVKAKA